MPHTEYGSISPIRAAWQETAVATVRDAHSPKKHGHNGSCSSNRRHKAKAGSREEQESAPSKDSKSGFVHKNEEKADEK